MNYDGIQTIMAVNPDLIGKKDGKNPSPEVLGHKVLIEDVSNLSSTSHSAAWLGPTYTQNELQNLQQFTKCDSVSQEASSHRQYIKDDALSDAIRPFSQPTHPPSHTLPTLSPQLKLNASILSLTIPKDLKLNRIEW